MNEKIKTLVNKDKTIVGDLIHYIDKYILSSYNKKLKDLD